MAVHKKQLTKKADQKARATLVMLERLHGKSIVEIQEEFNLSEATVHRDLTKVRQNNLIIAKAHQLILHRLLPKVMAVYDHHLDQGNLDAARDILHFFERSHSQGTHSAATDGVETLEIFRERYFRRISPEPTADASGHPPDVHGVVEGQLATEMGPPSAIPAEGQRALPSQLSAADARNAVDAVRLDAGYFDIIRHPDNEPTKQ